MKIYPPMFIYPKDVQRMTGKSIGHSRKMVREVREHYKRTRRQGTLINDFCSYNLSEADVLKQLS